MLQEERTVNEIEPPEDRTRTLPDEILEHVISFLPAQEAVQTCVLAKRWCHLWKSMPALRIIANEWLDEEGVKKLNMFIKSLLLKRNNSAQIDVCEVEIGEYTIMGMIHRLTNWFVMLCCAKLGSSGSQCPQNSIGFA